MNPKLEALKFIGYLNIHTASTGMYLHENTVQWHVEFEIRLGDQFHYKKRAYGELDPIIDELWEEATTWLSFYYPDYFRDIVNKEINYREDRDRYVKYAPAPRPLSERLGANKRAYKIPASG